MRSGRPITSRRGERSAGTTLRHRPSTEDMSFSGSCCQKGPTVLRVTHGSSHNLFVEEVSSIKISKMLHRDARVARPWLIDMENRRPQMARS